jgi:hypothetical protein
MCFIRIHGIGKSDLLFSQCQLKEHEKYFTSIFMMKLFSPSSQFQQQTFASQSLGNSIREYLLRLSVDGISDFAARRIKRRHCFGRVPLPNSPKEENSSIPSGYFLSTISESRLSFFKIKTTFHWIPHLPNDKRIPVNFPFVKRPRFPVQHPHKRLQYQFVDGI